MLTYINTYIYMLIQQEKDLDAARDFVPKESKEALKEISTDVAVENGDIYDKTGNAAIVVHTAHIDQDNFMEQACKWRMEKNTPIEKTSTSNSYIDLQCHICYKVTTETTEEDRNNTEMGISSTSSYRETMVSKTAILNNVDHCVDIPIFNANIYKTQNITCWTPPIFEVWLSDDDMNCKVLLGIYIYIYIYMHTHVFDTLSHQFLFFSHIGYEDSIIIISKYSICIHLYIYIYIHMSLH